MLAVQALLSARLVWADTAFQDEGAYLWAGHLEWAGALHGSPVPPFQTYFSGAPVIYPPLGALADSVGGLAGARFLSLLFMLGSALLLWDLTRHLFGTRAAFFAAALFALLGPTLHLGAFATYDAMSMFLLALATWCVAGAGQGEATGRIAIGGVVLALANATAYSTALFDPVVIVVALLAAWPAGRRVAVRRCATLLTVTAALLIAGLLLGGDGYLTGISQTTVERVAGSDPVLSVLSNAWSWTGVVLVLAWCGVFSSWAMHQGRRQTWLLAVLAMAALLGPLEQASLHTSASLNKHTDLGAWFAAIAAGYAADAFIASAPARRSRLLTTAGCVLALAFPAFFGITQSWAFATAWPNSASFVAIFRPLAAHGNLLVEDPGPVRYYLPSGAQWQRWSSTRNIVLPNGASTGGPARAGVVAGGNPALYARYISQGYFSIVALNFADTTSLDRQIRADLRRNHDYRIIEVVPYNPPGTSGTDLTGTYVIWRYKAPQ
ncbi:MAG TPA: glycosyltransferase family 39 protein [Streptosporangiaceae bacterium]|nr:glycosyltransferase family 39 protein [Streptosporangiaceae bacterium]